MNPLHTHDFIDKFKEAIPRPLELDDSCSGSDPITHKKIEEEEKRNETTEDQSITITTSSSSADTKMESIDASDQNPKTFKK